MAVVEYLNEWRVRPRGKRFKGCAPLRHQIEPPGDWFILCMQWGAGSGKTYTGGQLVRRKIDAGLWRTVNIAGPTWVDTMRTMVRGTSVAPGLMGLWPEHRKPILRAAHDDPYLLCWNGSKIQLFSAQKAERFRGPAADGGWLDEIDAWKPEGMTTSEAFSLFEQRIRTGPDPRIYVTSTPKRGRMIAELIARSDTVVTRATMLDNRANLNPVYVRTMMAKYKGTRRGRQELDGELLPDVEGAIVSAEDIEAARWTGSEPPELVRVVVGVDPYGGGPDACGIGVAGKLLDDPTRAAVLADRTCRLGPAGWGQRAIEAALEFDADCIVWESNFGGEMAEGVLRSAMERMDAHVRLKRVWSSKGKHLRFETPTGAMYERGEIHHVGTFERLEDEVTQFTPERYEGDDSPNAADALVFAMTELFPIVAGPQPGDLYPAADEGESDDDSIDPRWRGPDPELPPV